MLTKPLVIINMNMGNLKDDTLDAASSDPELEPNETFASSSPPLLPRGDSPKKALPKSTHKKVKKPKRPKKPEDMPRRPLSAYNIFFREQRSLILAQRNVDDDEGDGGVDDNNDNELDEVDNADNKKKRKPGLFESMAKTIAKRWKSLPSQLMEKYAQLARAETIRYREEMELYHQKLIQKSIRAVKDKAQREAVEAVCGFSATSALKEGMTNAEQHSTDVDEQSSHARLPFLPNTQPMAAEPRLDYQSMLQDQMFRNQDVSAPAMESLFSVGDLGGLSNTHSSHQNSLSFLSSASYPSVPSNNTLRSPMMRGLDGLIGQGALSNRERWSSLNSTLSPELNTGVAASLNTGFNADTINSGFNTGNNSFSTYLGLQQPVGLQDISSLGEYNNNIGSLQDIYHLQQRHLASSQGLSNEDLLLQQYLQQQQQQQHLQQQQLQQQQLQQQQLQQQQLQQQYQGRNSYPPAGDGSGDGVSNLFFNNRSGGNNPNRWR
jgi:hypothetical protein